MSRSIFVIHHYDASVCVFFTFSKNPKKYMLGGLQQSQGRESHNPPTLSVVLCQATETANAMTIARSIEPIKYQTNISFVFNQLITFALCLNHASWFFCWLGVLMIVN